MLAQQILEPKDYQRRQKAAQEGLYCINSSSSSVNVQWMVEGKYMMDVIDYMSTQDICTLVECFEKRSQELLDAIVANASLFWWGVIHMVLSGSTGSVEWDVELILNNMRYRGPSNGVFPSSLQVNKQHVNRSRWLQKRGYEIYHTTGDSHTAAAVFTNALNSGFLPENVKVGLLLNRSACYLQLGRFEDALKDSNNSLSIKKSAKGLYRRAMAYKGLNNWIDAYETAIIAKRFIETHDDNLENLIYSLTPAIQSIVAAAAISAACLGHIICPRLNNRKSPNRERNFDPALAFFNEHVEYHGSPEDYTRQGDKCLADGDDVEALRWYFMASQLHDTYGDLDPKQAFQTVEERFRVNTTWIELMDKLTASIGFDDVRNIMEWVNTTLKL
eukprot:NODE_3839_length_1276_cov_50.683435_g3364_i0.p1 GENE.NODE_3839_length_1276_cov_50.683435_g3364_i0~~NODE_3839_length_1276_cov_50.683435_g3364_i0.p1  ORF type:complete len:388 (+),score=68.92 NODE_3839_length_1276_cov_50.683435_g3364_i0:61-1224(+)